MEGGEMKIVVPESLQDQFGKQTEVSLDSMTKTQADALAKYQKDNEKYNVKDMAMSQLTATEKMSRGIDVIATYFKIQGAKFAAGLGEGAIGNNAKQMQEAIDNFSKAKPLGTMEDARKAGVKAGEIVANPIDYLEKKGKEMWNKITGNEPSTPQPMTQNVNMTITHKSEGPITDTVFNAVRKDPTSMEQFGRSLNSPKDLTTSNAAHKN
jgi:hypothetical protein